MKKLAVFFPGIGYTVDKPLMHYSRRLAAGMGYEIRLLPYTGFPKKIMGDRDRMAESYRIARQQTIDMLQDVRFEEYDDILFVGKSIGTIAAAEMAAGCAVRERIRMILYTPLEETFTFLTPGDPVPEAIVFTGADDPWVGREASRIPQLCRDRNIPCHIIPQANHSLESGIVGQDIRQMQLIMDETEQFMNRKLQKEGN